MGFQNGLVMESDF